jgi:hypothetical protein
MRRSRARQGGKRFEILVFLKAGSWLAATKL